MIDWSTVAPALKTLFSDIALATAVNPSFLAQWHGASQEHVHPEVQAELTLRVTRVAEFQTERRYLSEVVDDVETFSEQLFGMREFTLEVRVASHDHTESQSKWAWGMIERLRTSLLFQRAIDALLAVDVGLVSVSDSLDVSYKFDKRIVSAAMFEATFNAAFTLTDSVSADWFETVLLSSAMRNPGDVLLPTPPNLDEFQIGPVEDDED